MRGEVKQDHAWVGAQAVEDVHHALGLVCLAPDWQLLAWQVEHRPLAAARRCALPAASLLRPQAGSGVSRIYRV